MGRLLLLTAANQEIETNRIQKAPVEWVDFLLFFFFLEAANEEI